jgi:hypothetical protein
MEFYKVIEFILNKLYIQFQNKKNNVKIPYHKQIYKPQLVNRINPCIFYMPCCFITSPYE